MKAAFVVGADYGRGAMTCRSGEKFNGKWGPPTRAQTLHPYLDLPALIGDVNRLVCKSSPTHLFASLFYAEYEPAIRVLNYVNAGHTPPIVVRPGKGSCELFHLSAEGMPVGISADARFEATKFQLMIDDISVAYTDGITEAVNRSSDLWGIERLDTLLRSCGGMASGEIVTRILGEVSEFANGEPQRDDVTLVVMNVQEGCEVEVPCFHLRPAEELVRQEARSSD